MGELLLFDNARRALEQAASIDEVQDIRDKAEAMRLYLRQKNESLEMQNYCAEIKIRAERKLGEMLGEMEKRPAGRPSTGNRSHDVTDLPPKLSDLGISRMESSRCQSIASIPERIFDERVEKVKAEKKELTSADMLRMASTLKKQEKLQRLETTESETCVISDLNAIVESGVKFRCIYADPPWKYGNQSTRAATDNHYVTMTPEEIAALPISDLVETEAHLHLWTTNAFLRDAFDIISAWGFEYKSCFVWTKPQMGIGNYWRVSHEFMLLGTRGGLGFLDHSQMSWLQVDRTKHSSKPDRIRQIIELVSPGPYLELFGRVTTPNWTVWGNEIERNLFNQGLFNECV